MDPFHPTSPIRGFPPRSDAGTSVGVLEGRSGGFRGPGLCGDPINRPSSFPDIAIPAGRNRNIYLSIILLYMIIKMESFMSSEKFPNAPTHVLLVHRLEKVVIVFGVLELPE